MRQAFHSYAIMYNLVRIRHRAERHKYSTEIIWLVWPTIPVLSSVGYADFGVLLEPQVTTRRPRRWWNSNQPW